MRGLREQVPLKGTDQIARDLYDQSQGADLDGGLEALEGADLVRAHALLVLQQSPAWRVEAHPGAVLDDALVQGAEHACLKQGGAFDPEPAPNGTNGAFILKSCSPRLFASDDWKQAKPVKTGFYRPQHRALNGVDGCVAYWHPGTMTQYVVEGDVLSPTGFDVNETEFVLPKSFDLDNAPPILKIGEVPFQRAGSRHVDPGEEMLRERLYWVVTDWLSERLGDFSAVAFPHVQLVALPHAAFGAQHHLGTRQPYLEGLQPLREAASGEKREQILALERSLIHSLTVPMILMANGSTFIDNIFIYNDKLVQMTGGWSFPHFRGALELPRCRHEWFWLPQAGFPIAGKWQGMISGLKWEALYSAVEGEINELNRRFPDRKFSVPVDVMYPLLGGLILLQEGIKAQRPLRDIASFQDLRIRFTSEGHLDLEHFPKGDPGEFWASLELAAFDLEFPYRDAKELPSSAEERVRHYLHESFDMIWGANK
jgi:hypothetical protein